MGRSPVGFLLAGLLLSACGDSASPPGLTADDIPVAHTPPGGFGDTFPPPVLARCTDEAAMPMGKSANGEAASRGERAGAPLPEGDRF